VGSPIAAEPAGCLDSLAPEFVVHRPPIELPDPRLSAPAKAPVMKGRTKEGAEK
jgi:hypothetical protein